MSTNSPRSLALRLAAEFAVIVIGVLVALGVDSWAAGRRDRAQETEYLTRLLNDVQFDLQELAFVDSVSRIGFDASSRLSDPAVVDSMSPGRLVSGVLVVSNVRVPDLSRATFAELVNSGQIQLIRSHSVRRALASYDRTVNELDGAWNIFAPDLRRWLAARIPHRIYRRFTEAEGCARYPERAVTSLPIICDLDLDGWSPERLRADVTEESGQEVFQMAEYTYAAHTFFASLLFKEAQALEAVLLDAVAER